MLFIDTYNLYHCVQRRHNNRVLDYEKLFTFLVDTYKFLEGTKPTAYVAKTHKSDGFVKYLQNQFTCFVRVKEIRIHKYDNFDVDLALDVLRCESENIVICSSSLNLMSMLSYLHESKKNVYVHAAGIPKDFAHLSLTRELPQRLLRDVDEPAIAV